MPTIKIVMLGGGGVGKSAITMQFIQNTFISDYDPTIENSYRKQITVDEEAVVLDVLDTAGQEDYAAMRDSQIRSGNGFLCVYSIISPESFSELNDFRERVLQVKDRDEVPLILIGNKCDLAKSRKVKKAEGEKLAEEYNVPFYECSAKAKINIDQAFEECVRLVIKASENGELGDDEGNAFVPTSKMKKKSCIIL
eukprot:TRINITY_DN3116_c0_g2_i1.p1 TRINITY_DN3116_c0_g2~~TRINITY_DN3116_c0_g2_i1.p1  ORF type:complete len:196 (-),score=26.62 TRINITY_DN3116_c0_g2_i1:82-669(-)